MSIRVVNRRTTKKLFRPWISVISIYLWCCSLLGRANSDQYMETYQRPKALQILELKIDTLVTEFKSASHHNAELGQQILGVAAELKEYVSTYHKVRRDRDGYSSDQFTCDYNYSERHPMTKGFISWTMQKFGSVFQCIGLFSGIYLILQLLKVFKKSHLPKISIKWNTLMRKITFDPSFDYMVDVYQPNY